MPDRSDTQPPHAPSPPHGFGDDARSRFLRRRPPPEALRWVERSLGAPVTRVEARKGGSSSAIHVLTVGGERVVLRRYVLGVVVEEEPDIVEQEVRALGVLGRSAAPTPVALAADPSGQEAGVPALAMTCLPGRVEWSPRDLDAWLRRLAEALAPVHATPWRPADGIRPFRPYAPDRWERPPGLRDPSVWDRAVAVFHGPPVDPAQAFVARDFHPGNVLFRRGRVSGVVDWQAAAIGPPSVDVSHCRVNLVDRFGLEVAERFTGMWEAASGERYHPWAEAATAVDVLRWSGPPASDRERRRREEAEASVARALAALGM